MGFGWFLTGYFFVSVISLYSPLSFAMLAGYPMLIFALRQLAPYHRAFKACFYLSFVSLPFALYYGAYGLSQTGLFSLPIFAGATWQSVEWSYFVFTLVFTALWLYAVAQLSGELGVPRLQGAAMRNLLMFALLCVLDFVARLPIPFIQKYPGYFGIPIVLLRLLLIFLNLYLIYSCYRTIGPEGEDLVRSAPKKKEGDNHEKK